ncbi:UNVERIFIED_CONTAM: transcriptional regulator [Euhalothece sp. KZN 001]
MKLEVTKLGDSVGVIFPKQLLDKLKINQGNSLYAVETKNGVELKSYDPELIKQMEIAEEIMSEDEDVLKKLAE